MSLLHLDHRGRLMQDCWFLHPGFLHGTPKGLFQGTMIEFISVANKNPLQQYDIKQLHIE